MSVSELEGMLLDYCVAKAEGKEIFLLDGKVPYIAGTNDQIGVVGRYGNGYVPSSNWSQGGPIIEREKIRLWDWTEKTWCARREKTDRTYAFGDGLTPLEAAMRCYVASKATPEQIAEWVKETRR